jgi:hypothetical protein
LHHLHAASVENVRRWRCGGRQPKIGVRGSDYETRDARALNEMKTKSYPCRFKDVYQSLLDRPLGELLTSPGAQTEYSALARLKKQEALSY